MFALNLGKDGRILSATLPEYAPPDAATVEKLPEGDISDYLYKEGEYVHSPLPRVEPETVPTVEERIATLETLMGELSTKLSAIFNILSVEEAGNE